MRSENSPEVNSQPVSNHQLEPHQWVELHADYLYTYAITRINDAEQARDLVQETFLAALERLDGFRGDSSERTWLTAILKNKVIDAYRKQSSFMAGKSDVPAAERQQHDFFDPDDGHWNAPYRPQLFGVEDQDPLQNKEFMATLQRCMQKLPSLWLSVFTLKHLDEETTEAICQQLRLTSSNFWVIIHRAKLNLRACLQKHWI